MNFYVSLAVSNLDIIGIFASLAALSLVFDIFALYGVKLIHSGSGL
jgi:hypothetical protein